MGVRLLKGESCVKTVLTQFQVALETAFNVSGKKSSKNLNQNQKEKL